MQIGEIVRNDQGYYVVTIIPGWLGRLFGQKERTETFRATGNYYMAGGDNVYVNKDGEKLRNGDPIGVAIDKWRQRP